MTGEQVMEAFGKDDSLAQDLKGMYGIVPERLAACHTGALDLLNDALFALPVEKLQQDWNMPGRPVYRYVMDQADPWQSSHRAHHAVDLLLLFGGFDISFDSATDKVGHDMRVKWIAYVNGSTPWSPSKTYAFGPHGKCGEIDETELASRRRKRHMDFLRTYEPVKLSATVRGLAAGRISLLN